MSNQNPRKLNRLLAELGDTRLISSRWLRAHGYSNSLVARYVGSGWLVSPARGVYMRQGGRLQWDGVVRSLQAGEGMPLHLGGRFALILHGYEHSLHLGDAGTITLYGPARPPGWVGKLPLQQRFAFLGKGPFDLPAASLTAEVSESVPTESVPTDNGPTDNGLSDNGLSDNGLSDNGLAWHQPASRADALVWHQVDSGPHALAWHQAGAGTDALLCSTPERAVLELCDAVSDAAGVYEADALMQAMTTLRPQQVALMLRHCRSIKAKRLFLALADRHGHAWLADVSLEGVDLGRGKRALVPGGRLHPTYQITLPGDLDEHL